ncbi:hypothetical protein [uncultured Psychroserpens sp.]|uniref:hypothetical protein n=1 Tax=uncultured Psychroserpens sp. TaxID=255436 RepID=UPI00262B1DA3|nr:hypothetical protein [uncultured Psychroserpens sp.]
MKNFFLFMILTALFASCSSDDDTINPIDIGESIIRITEVNADTDEIIISNFGDASVDIGTYWLCLGPGTYVQISDATNSSTNLSPNQNITLSYDVNPTADGLSIFTTNTFGSSDPNVLLDYVQWGAANQARVNQAITAGRWDNANNFVQEGSPYIFNGQANQFGSTFWEGTTVVVTPTPSVVKILEVNTTTDQVTISNLGGTAIDIGDYWLCLGPGTYVQVSNAASGSTNLAPNASITLSYDVNPTADGLSIFSTNSFGSTDPNVLVDYVQWGAANQARVNQAVTAGRWDNADNFLQGGSPYNFTGEADDFGSTFWN